MNFYYVYILASRRHGTLYVGVTNDLIRRVSEHRQKLTPGFTSKYDVSRLVYYEPHNDIEQAILREKRLKRWRRDWKMELIERDNPNWDDIYPGLLAPPSGSAVFMGPGVPLRGNRDDISDG